MNHYKKIIAACLCACLYCLPISAYEDTQKVYIQRDAIDITDDGIFLFLGDLIVLVDELNYDKDGYFVYGLDIALSNVPFESQDLFPYDP